MKKKSLSVLIALSLTATTLLPAASVFADTTAATPVTTAPASTYGVEYEGHVQNIGWQTPVITTGDQTDISNVNEAGTDGKSLRVEAVKITGTNLPAGASITYQAQVQNKGWMTPVTTTGNTAIDSAAEAGTDGQGLRVETFKMTLNGLPGYAIKYQTHVQNIGWQDAVTTANGTDINSAAIAGTVGQGLRMEAVKIEIVKTDAEKAAEVAAINAVQTAEASKSYTDVAAATTAVKSVQDTVENAALTARIAAINVNLEVTSVSAIDGHQLLVKFTKPVDSTTATTATNYAITGGNTVASATLQADKQSVVLNLGTAVAKTTSATYGITISGVASAADTSITNPLFAGVVTIADTTAPTVTGVTATTSTSFATAAKVTFSEPVAAGYTIKVDGTLVPVNPAADGLSATLDLTSVPLSASSAHTLEAVGLNDASGNATSYQSVNFNVTSDTVAPVITSVAPKGDHQILLTFSKNMGTANLTAANFAVKDQYLNNVGGAIAVTPLAGDTTGTKWVLDFAAPSNFYTATGVTSRTLTLVVKGSGLTDVDGNALADTTQTVTLNKDTTSPSVVGVTVQKNSTGAIQTVTVQYNKPVVLATTPGALQFVDSNGVLVTGTVGTGTVSPTDSTKVVYAVGTTTGFTGTYSVTIPSDEVTDTALTPNNSLAYNGTVDFGAATSSSTFTATAASSNDKTNVITVAFATPVKGGAGTGSATLASNYTINGAALPAGTTITLNNAAVTVAGTSYPTQSVATITLPAGTVATTDAAAVFRANGIVGLNSQTLTPLVSTLQVTDNTAPVLNSAVLNSDGTISIGFTNAINPLSTLTDGTDVVVNINGTATPATVNAGTGLNAGKYILTVANLKVDSLGAYIDNDTTGLKHKV